MKKMTKFVIGAANVLTALGIGAVVGLDTFDVSTDVLEDKRLKNMRIETRVKKPGSLFKRKAIVDGYGNVVEWL